MSESDTFSRRGALKAGLTILAGTVVATAARADNPDDGKIEKSVVQYQYKWNADGSHCGICANFLPPANGEKIARCKVVAGPIDPNGYCIAFAPKGAAP
jgi:hypothetical protein